MSQVEIVRGMPEREYRARPEKSQSDDKYYMESKNPTPAHAKFARDEGFETSDAMLAGTCLHALVLSGEVVYEVNRDCKTQKNPKQYNGIILSPYQAAIVEGMALGIRRNAQAMAILNSRTETEVSIFWDGMKARLDAVCPLGALDLKTTRKFATRWNFSESIYEFGYHLQAAMYLEAAAVAGFPNENFYFVVVENFPPYECNFFPIGHESLELGAAELARCRAIRMECERTNTYPGYPQTGEEINLRDWVFKKKEGVI